MKDFKEVSERELSDRQHNDAPALKSFLSWGIRFPQTRCSGYTIGGLSNPDEWDNGIFVDTIVVPGLTADQCINFLLECPGDEPEAEKQADGTYTFKNWWD